MRFLGILNEDYQVNKKLLDEYKKNNESKMKDSDYLFYNADVRNAVLIGMTLWLTCILLEDKEGISMVEREILPFLPNQYVLATVSKPVYSRNYWFKTMKEHAESYRNLLMEGLQ